jgi:excisionase family DNA binding protein
MEALVGVEEAGRLLGLSPKTVRKLILNRRLPFRKLGARVLLKPSELDAWAEARKVPALSVRGRR